MPTDSRTTDVIVSILGTSTVISTGAVTVIHSGPRLAGREQDSRTYVQSRRRPEGFVNPKSYSRAIFSGRSNLGCHPFFASGKSNGLLVVQQGISISAVQYVIAVPPFDGDLANRALIDAKLKLKDQDVNLALAFAERAKTANLVASNVMRLAKAYRAARRGDFRKASRHLGVAMPGRTKKRDGKKPEDGKELHDAWLELQYGWKPLLSDIHGVTETLRKKDLDDPTRYGCTVKSRKSSRYNDITRVDVVSESNHPLFFNQRLESESGAFVRLDYYRSSPALAALAQVGLTNPLEIAWELIPFSFVVDWVAPVGNYLSVLDAELGWTFRAGSLSTRQVTRRLGWITPRNIPGWDSLSASGYYTAFYKNMDRYPYVTSPVPAFSFKNPVSGLHLANALALLSKSVK